MWLRRHGVYLACAMALYPALLFAAVAGAGAREPLAAERARCLAVCLIELGVLAIAVPWMLAATRTQGAGGLDASLRTALWRTALLLAVPCAVAVAVAGGSRGWALPRALAAQLQAACFAALLAGLWLLLAALLRPAAPAQALASLVGGLMLSTLFWSPLVLEPMSSGPWKSLAIDLIVWFNPALNAAAGAFGWDLTTMPIGYRLGVLASYDFRYFSYAIVALSHGALGAVLGAVGFALVQRQGRLVKGV